MTAIDRRPALEFVTHDAALAALRYEWADLLADADGASVFLTHAWISAWHGTVGADEELLIGLARQAVDGRLIGIAPFSVVSRKMGPVPLRVLRMAGSGLAASDHLDLIIRHGHPHAAAALWRATNAHRTWDLIDLDGLRAGSHLSRVALRRTGDRESFAATTVCPVLELPETWEEYEASLGRNLRQNLGRYSRKLDRDTAGPVVERMVVDPADVVDTVDRLAGFHQQIRTARGDDGSFADPRMVAFHKSAALRFLDAGRLRLHRLDVDGSMAAAISCFRHDETVSFYTTGYDPALSSYGPGRRIMAAAIRSAIDEGARRFDFLRGDEAYKRDWGATEAYDDRIRMPMGPKGNLLHAAAGMVRRVRRGLVRGSGR
ncbi:MAG: GNAT family N-acetyltransferase [Acidimicrobiia bacterium]|nr:GNAT family N-acetyltransferase [Acidimicrobiia bacterium]